MMQNVLVFMGIALLAGCPPAAAPIVSDAPVTAAAPAVASAGPNPVDRDAILAAQVREASERVRALLRDETIAWWQAWTQGTPLDPALAIRRRETLDAGLRATLAHPGFSDRRDVALLDHLVSGELLGERVTPAAQARSEAVSAAKVKLAEQEVALVDVEAQLAAEPSAQDRAALDAAASSALAGLVPTALAFRAGTLQAARELGGSDPVTFLATLHETTPDELRTVATAVLEATETAYLDALDARARAETGLTRAKLRRADLPRLLRPRRVETAFSGQAALDATLRTFAAIGLEVPKAKGISLDSTPSPKRQPRAATFIVEAPTDVRVSIRPGAGEDHLRALLHEFATAIAAAQRDRGSWETRLLGTALPAAAFADLAEELVTDPTWLAAETTLAPADAAQLAEHGKFRRLWIVRRLAAEVLFALEPATGDEAARWKTLLSRASGVALSDSDGLRWTLDVDPLLGAADHLLAWTLAARLHGTLAAPWHRQPASGAALVDGLADGSLHTFSELVAKAGGITAAAQDLARW